MKKKTAAPVIPVPAPLVLSEIQGQNQARGLVCPKCGCRHFEVVWVRPFDGGIRRRRACRHCGWKITTTERLTG